MRLWKGLQAPLDSFRFLIAHPSLVVLIVIPFLLTCGFFALFYWFWSSWILTLLSHLPAEGAWAYLQSGVEVLSWLLFAFVSVFSFSLIGTIVLSPFNDQLCFRVLKIRGFVFEDQKFIPSVANSVIDAVKMSGLKLMLFILSLFFPILTPFLFFIFIGLDYFDYPWGHQTQGLVNKLKLLKRDLPAFTGFSLSFGFLFMVPFVLMLLMPFAVIGASLQVLDKDKEDRPLTE